MTNPSRPFLAISSVALRRPCQRRLASLTGLRAPNPIPFPFPTSARRVAVGLATGGRIEKLALLAHRLCVSLPTVRTLRDDLHSFLQELFS